MCQVQRSPFLPHEGRWLIAAHRPSVLVCGGQKRLVCVVDTKAGSQPQGQPADSPADAQVEAGASAHGSQGQSCAIHAPPGAPRELSLVEACS